ncbi:putative general amino acid permease [Venturia nashicola]|uniref:Putative general amino acid permease n=1 Tax=Venturia nashicola TaxID=86259 RepID=A0A4Z1NK47_9PEZI|nr:putative general amino acid permease [Venturia nashicola]
MEITAEKGLGDGVREIPRTHDVDSDTGKLGDNVQVLETAGSDNLHRKLSGFQVQLFAIGGAIGTSLFVQMGSVLPKSGPAGLFIGFALWSTIIWAVNECFAEMVCYLPVQSPFIRLAGHWVDDALSFAMGWNFFLNMALLIPFEIVAFNIMITFWTHKIPVEAIIVIIIVAYSILNLVTVRLFGISEAFFSAFKVVLIFMLFLFTLLTMIGANPIQDRYGFRYWNKPGAFVAHIVPGSTGKFLGIISAMVQASFTICGPEYISMVAGEAKRPRKVLPAAFKTFPFRLLFFFVGGALAISIVIPYDDPTLAAILAGTATGAGTGAASPYIIAMQRLEISGLPHLVNALILTSVFSSGNGLTYAATRSLYGMATEGRAPKIFTKTSKSGIPWVAAIGALSFCLLAFLQVSSSSSSVLTWLVDLITACQLLNYLGTCVTYLHFRRACDVQGVSRESFSFKARLQPYGTYYAIFGLSLFLLLLGYDLFFPGGWSYLYFFLDYGMLAAFPIAMCVWKVVKKTNYVRPEDADLTLGSTKKEIEDYNTLAEIRDERVPAKWYKRIMRRVME